jgi:glycine/D-amino acid oxidase-like deaminating enzyme
LNYGNEVGAKLAIESFKVFEDFEKAVGGTAKFRRVGYLGCVDESNVDAMEESAKMQRALGANNRTIRCSEIKSLVPAMNTDGIALASYEPDSGYADAFATTFSYVKQAEQMGATILEGTAAKGLEIDGNSVRGVITDKGTISSTTVIAATGVWTNKFFQSIGVALPITVTRHEVGMFRTPKLAGGHPVLMDFTTWVYVRPEEGGLTIVGAPRMSGSVIDPDNYDQVVSQETLNRYWVGAKTRFPDFATAAPRGGWTGPYDNTPDLYPILDRVPGVGGLYVAAGFSGHGFKLTPAIGRVTAEFVKSGKVRGFDIERLSLSRFERKMPNKRRYTYEWE